MELYEASAAWRELTSQDTTSWCWMLSQPRRANMCLSVNPEANGYAYIDSVHLQMDGQVGKALMRRDCDLIECVYNLDDFKAWYEVGGASYSIDQELPLVALQSEDVFLCIQGKPLAQGAFRFPSPTVKKCVLRSDYRQQVSQRPQPLVARRIGSAGVSVTDSGRPV